MRQRAISHSLHALARHPWARHPHAVARQARVRATLRHHVFQIGNLRKAGFIHRHGGPRLLHVMDGYIYGFTLQQLNLPSQTQAESSALAEDILRGFPVDDFPSLAEMIVEHALKPGYDYAQEFHFGLDLILDGLERIRAAA